MTKLEAAYAEYGMDYDETIGRTADGNYAALNDALDAENASAAFGAAHALKGSSGMLGMTRLYRVMSDMTERLREGDITAAKALRDAAAREYKAAVRMIASL